MPLKYLIHTCPQNVFFIGTHSMLRPVARCSQFQGTRSFHLVHNLFTRDQIEATRQLNSLSRKIYPSADHISVALFYDDSGQVATMTLTEVLQRVRLKPYSFLAQEEPEIYRIKTYIKREPAEPIRSHKINHKPWKRAGRGKESHLTTACTPQFLRHVLGNSCKYLLEGSRMEFHLHQESKDKQNRTTDWALTHCLHLRPDSILAAMPEGTRIFAQPATTDLSHKTRLSKNYPMALSQVMWAMENVDALRRAHNGTSQRILDRAAWPERASPKEETSDEETSDVAVPTSA